MYMKLLNKHIKKGILHLHLPNGREHHFGTGGPEAHWYIQDEHAIRRIAKDWEFQLGETYVRGLWHAGDQGLRNLLAVLRANFAVSNFGRWLQPFTSILREWNRITRSYHNVSHHYDVPEAVFRLFLDKEMFYSCAYFTDDKVNLEQAQQAKAAHIAAKLLPRAGDRILDIGCGWGSMAFHLARHHDCEVVGITLSREQLAVARREAQARKLGNVRFELADYREHSGNYQRIVSIGMFEHVGRPFYDTFFNKLAEMLTPDGVALVHTIGRTGPPGLTNPWINKYIFPGGSTPSLSEISASIERSACMLTDVEVWRLHYALTLRQWYERFQAQRPQIKDLMQEEFCRMWEFYLAACESAFRYSDLVVYQCQLARSHESVPLTRDYLYH